MSKPFDTMGSSRGRSRLQKHGYALVTHTIEAERLLFREATLDTEGLPRERIDTGKLRMWLDVASMMYPYIYPKMVDLGEQANSALLALARAIDASLPSGHLTTNKDDNPKLTQGVTALDEGVTPVDGSFVELDVPRVPED